MTKEQAKHLAEVLNAYAEGKTIEVFLDLDWKWVEVPSDGYCFDVENKSYRIKKEPKYRPFKNAKECFEEMKKHYPIGWICRDGGFQQITRVGTTYIKADEYIHFFGEKFHKKVTFADGQPFGIQE